MNGAALHPPGIRVEVTRPAAETSLRSDIAGFIGPTRRGPIGIPVRVEGWRGYRLVFGALDLRHDTTYAIRGYFENGGEVAWVVRLARDTEPIAQAIWTPNPALPGLPAIAFHASSPGDWAAGVEVDLTYRRDGKLGEPEIDLFIRTPGEPTETLLALPAFDLAEALAVRSLHLRCVPFPRPLPPLPPGPRVRVDRLRLELPAGPPAMRLEAAHYLDGADTLADLPEVAIVAAPDLWRLGAAAALPVIERLVLDAEQLHDRLVLIDPPRVPRETASTASLADALSRWAESELGRDPQTDDVPWRAAAAYFPWLRVPDPLGAPAEPVRSLAPSGHVAGVISALDRARGAHHTPALEPMIGVVDLEREVGNDDHAILNLAGINVIRCVPGRGFAMWGGRTLDLQSDQRYLAHRRFVHRLVRAIHRVAEPLVFESNGPTLWLQLIRAITTVLLEAWRTGALKGDRAEEAFVVQCDEETNRPEEIDAGRCLCLVSFAPAAPMEFIVLRLSLGRDGSLEVLP